jgi:phage FluMu protein Com
MTMQNQASIEELKQLPSVGETTAKDLQESGYGSFESLARASPMVLHRECNIVLSSATHIISASVEHLEGNCPRCKGTELNNQWQEYSDAIPDSEGVEIVCGSCGWYGEISELES